MWNEEMGETCFGVLSRVRHDKGERTIFSRCQEAFLLLKDHLAASGEIETERGSGGLVDSAYSFGPESEDVDATAAFLRRFCAEAEANKLVPYHPDHIQEQKDAEANARRLDAVPEFVLSPDYIQVLAETLLPRWKKSIEGTKWLECLPGRHWFEEGNQTEAQALAPPPIEGMDASESGSEDGPDISDHADGDEEVEEKEAGIRIGRGSKRKAAAAENDVGSLRRDRAGHLVSCSHAVQIDHLLHRQGMGADPEDRVRTCLVTGPMLWAVEIKVFNTPPTQKK
jgi:hypothetical protein